VSASARVTFAPADTARNALAPLAAILALGFVVRLLFIGSTGFHNDVSAFESWTLTLRDHSLSQFYAKSGFADYPPGYFVVLWLLAKIYAIVPGSAGDPAHGYVLLRTLVKLPAIVMDLVNAAVVYAIVRRYAKQSIALFAAAALALNPAAIYVSAYWGQVDAVSWGFVLIALLLVLRAGDDPSKTLGRLTWAWLAFGFSLLIKPQAATIGLVLLAYPFATADAAVRMRRLAGTGAGIVASLGLALVVALLFHPAGDVLGWLLSRYVFGSGVYAYTSVNAFNLYAIRWPFWQPDGNPLVFAGMALGPLSAWGIGLVAASTALIVGRYVQRKDDRALLESAMLCAFVFFLFATRMHERYIYGAFLLAMPLIGFGISGMLSAFVLTVTMYLNLAYSLAYQTVMEAKTAGVDATNLWPLVSHPAALLNVGLFFVLGALHLGVIERPAADAPSSAGETLEGVRTLLARGRAWFDPREGVRGMTRLDWLLAAGFTLGAFVMTVLWLNFPAEKYFDEIYYARAGEEYLQNKDVSGWGPFEFTHPPLTKLLITLSMLLFGGMHGGDTGIGWRFLNVVVGALMVGVLYAFAKRLTASTLFASLGAGMLALDGFRYVQSRIATPEITVAFLSLCTLYAFYRLWLASQVARRAPAASDRGYVALAATAFAGVVIGAFVALVVVPHASGPITIRGQNYVGWAQGVAFVWLVILFWLIARVAVVPRVMRGTVETSYADGTRILTGPDGAVATTLDGTTAKLAPGTRKELLRAQHNGLRRTLDASGTLTYETPVAAATYAPDGTARVEDVTSSARDARVWWIVLAVVGALLADAKWNGLFDFGVVWLIAGLVAAQRWLRAPARYGNPFGMPVDVVVAAMVVAGGIVYTLSYIPYFTQGHGFVDMVAMQQDMYRYHSTLVATHPYASGWWQWPILDKPILYYASYTHSAPHGAPDCCVSTIRALPNPIVWWAGLISVPWVGWLAFRERNKGYTLLIAAYLLQWLPWMRSPRLAFEYHFLPNLAIIVLANAVVLQRIWNWTQERDEAWPRYAVAAYAVAVVAAFVYFFPIVSGTPIPWAAWQARMWNPHWI
jgi:Gpi18-like mannosyltransferase/predicted membrane-bound dolichyl-phosphate-mannose-protein mannosyltransferase